MKGKAHSEAEAERRGGAFGSVVTGRAAGRAFGRAFAGRAFAGRSLVGPLVGPSVAAGGAFAGGVPTNSAGVTGSRCSCSPNQIYKDRLYQADG